MTKVKVTVEVIGLSLSNRGSTINKNTTEVKFFEKVKRMRRCVMGKVNDPSK